MTEYHQQSSAEVMKILNVTTQGLTDDDVQKGNRSMAIMY